MARQPIELGSAPNDGTGDPLRSAFGKVNHNEEELYTLLGAKAPLDSPALTGTPTAPTQAPGNDSTRVATTAFVQAVVAALIDASPAQLNTLNELAAALGDDANFAATVTAAIAEKAAKTEVWRVIAKSAVPVVHTGTTAQTDVVTVVIPAGAMGPNGKVRIDALITCNNDADMKMHYLLLGGSTLNAANMASTTGMRLDRVISNVNSQSAQKTMPTGSGSFGSFSAAIQTTAVNTAVAQNLTLTCLLGSAADTITIEDYTVEILYGA